MLFSFFCVHQLFIFIVLVEHKIDEIRIVLFVADIISINNKFLAEAILKKLELVPVNDRLAESQINVNLLFVAVYFILQVQHNDEDVL